MSGPFHRASNFKIDNLEIVQANTVTYAGKSALERLEEHISPGAAHNSDERCDAPKCHPETRAAVQDEILSWITEGGDSDAEPKRLLWLTGPAGTGKTAIAGSVAETCSENGLLAATFFFSSFSGSADRRSKACFVPTLAYQLRKHRGLQDVGKAILSAIDNDPAIFSTRVKDQFEELVLRPFRQLSNQSSGTSLFPKVIVIDGVDECEPLKAPGQSITKEEAQIAREREHLEILDVLFQAVCDPAFPFRIVVVSRPERQFATFFSETASDTTLKLFLDDKYDPNADIELFLHAKFAEIRRRYHFPPSWPTPAQIRSLVSNASGQFIYAATVIRFVDSRTHLPQEQLDCVLDLEKEPVETDPKSKHTVPQSKSKPNPFRALDALYLHILRTCPDPLSTVEWMWNINETESIYDPSTSHSVALPAAFWRQFIEWTPGEMEHLLGCIPSLMFVPPPEDRLAPIRVYHKSIHDFLEARKRCAELFLPPYRRSRNYHRRLLRIIKDKGPVLPCPESEHDKFLAQFLGLTILLWPEASTAIHPDDKNILLSSDAQWWVDRYLDDESITRYKRALKISLILHSVHASVSHFQFSLLLKV
ncbi:hypothetical protein DFP72DRAFT_1077106 [Ephemerocybe angulata]|uniref:Nephrocystin 3-like N-terminal domain-containing protein n=1 Tax=Ephemerocybe angulata TaxID=980116 RepID=A0A8H6HG48_9AGAR|nr:hypothetical protein DFP72DRAFT_1077106 [Tulosesus angulatus]